MPRENTPPNLNHAGGEQTVVIGWREYVDLPEWGAAHVKAKADTGARTSAIDVADLEELPNNRVRFDVVVHRGDEDVHETIETDIVRRTRVKSSFGRSHDRLFVRTIVQVGPHAVEAELGLVSRKNMLCRMLLGRKFLEGRFLVDSKRRYILGRRRRKQPSKKAGKS